MPCAVKFGVLFLKVVVDRRRESFGPCILDLLCAGGFGFRGALFGLGLTLPDWLFTIGQCFGKSVRFDTGLSCGSSVRRLSLARCGRFDPSP